ncbi:hypothetical protein [Spiroplasma clarkii]|uniref:hypothetical protein n=1 Tax=Spiroplasma clarkii TaxID=2139 RepID=UPI0011BAD0B6|nr:hypothetical protein [Spiroplasma clarkii]
MKGIVIEGIPLKFAKISRSCKKTFSSSWRSSTSTPTTSEIFGAISSAGGKIKISTSSYAFVVL